MNYLKAFTICLFIAVLTACNDSRIFDEVINFPSDQWESDKPINFTINISDTTTAYDILVHIRNNNRYEFSNLWMFIETSSPSGASLTDTIEFVLADDKGQWYGKGLGSINSLLIPYKQNIRFPYRGVYSFTFRQAMRKDVIIGVKDVGICVQEHD
jgi:gliding motility-associated lipoprotein GldH